LEKKQQNQYSKKFLFHNHKELIVDRFQVFAYKRSELLIKIDNH